jgi:hypothetical protein
MRLALLSDIHGNSIALDAVLADIEKLGGTDGYWVPAYPQTIDDEWAALLEQIDQCCRTAWQYRIPDAASEQAELHTLVERTLAFENHFLGLYRQFLVKELMSEESDAQRATLESLGRTSYADPTVRHALQHLATTDEVQVNASARALIRQMDASN